MTVQQTMTQDLVYCFDDQDIRAAATLMEDKQLRRLVILDRDKKLVGIVSPGDLAIETANERLVGQVLERVSESVDPEKKKLDPCTTASWWRSMVQNWPSRFFRMWRHWPTNSERQ